MILVYNVCVTPDVSSYNLKYNRGKLPSFDKIDILKYSLSSMSVIPWEFALINVELTSYYKVFEKAIKEYVEKEFQNVKYKFSKTRAQSQKEWQKLAKTILSNDDDVIFFCGNHDHIFLSPDLNIFNSAEKLLKESESIYDAVCYSHRSFYRNSEAHFQEDFNIYQLQSFDSMVCVKARSFWEFWHSFDTGNNFIPRSDWVGAGEHNILWNIYSYHRIFCEHFDGQGYHPNYPINIDPPQVIPPGFFENDIKINFGLNYKNNYYNLNPFSNKHKCVYNDGTDSYWSLEDIPLFWKNRISQIEIDYSLDMTKAKYYSALRNIMAVNPFVFKDGSNKNLQIETFFKYRKTIFSDVNFLELYKEGFFNKN